MPSPAKLRYEPDPALQTRDFFDRLAHRWDDMAHAPEEKIDAILTRAGVPRGGHVLDVACGTGILFPALLRRSPVLLRAIDLSPGMVAQARLKYAGAGVEISAEDFYTFRQRGFDCMVVYNAYPHFLDKALFASQALRCLNTGGRLVIAHGCGRRALNTRHHTGPAQAVSTPLLSCSEEALRLGYHFAFDVMVDEEDRYILSGVKK